MPKKVQDWFNYLEEKKQEIEKIDKNNIPETLEDDLKVKGFSNLREFGLGRHELNSLEITGCPKLTEIDFTEFYSPLLTNLRINKCNSLNKIRFHLLSNLSQKKVGLTIDNCPNLTLLDCSDKRLIELAVIGGKLKLGWLDCSGNELTELKLNDCRNLTDLDCSWNSIRSLDLNVCSKITKIDCSHNKLKSLEASDCKNLVELKCYYNDELTNINVNNESVKVHFYDNGSLTIKIKVKESGVNQKIKELETEDLEKSKENSLVRLSEEVDSKKIIVYKEKLDKNSGKDIEYQKKIEASDLEESLKKEKLTSSTEKPTLERLIGKGGFGEVYYGKWKLQDVAVKKPLLLPCGTSNSDLEDIMNEINILKNLRNRYIIQYYDTYSDDQELLIIMDYAENGTLTKFINDKKDKEPNWNFNNELIRQMTLGLIYIHHENIIHRDLKSMNILLTHGYQVKISDFGLSKIKSIGSSFRYSRISGSWRWMAPESLDTENSKYSKQSDIYTLGMIIWEIATKCTKPFKDVDDNLAYVYIVSRKKKETIPKNTPKDIENIIQRCWKDNPKERITLESIIYEMEKEKEKKTEELILNSQDIHTGHSSGCQNLQAQSSEIRCSNGSNLDINKFNKNNQNWTDICPDFAEELIQKWQSNNFTCEQCKEWINIGLQPTDYNFCAWLRDTKKLIPEQVLNHHNLEQLNQEFFQWWQEQQQAQIEQLPK